MKGSFRVCPAIAIFIRLIFFLKITSFGFAYPLMVKFIVQVDLGRKSNFG